MKKDDDGTENLPGMYVWVHTEISEMQDLSLREIGAFMLLKLNMWRNKGVIADNNKVIARYLGLNSAKEAEKIKEKLALKLEFFEGNLTVPGLQKHFAESLKKHKANVANGSKGGKKSALNKRVRKIQEESIGNNIVRSGEKKLGDVLEASFKALELEPE